MSNPAIEIIGGGIAGLSLAIGLKKLDPQRHVTVLEAGTYPRHRVCGEFIAGLPANTLATLGLEDLFHGAPRLRQTSWYLHNRFLFSAALPHPAIALSRWQFDQILAARAEASSVEVVTNHRVKPVPGKVGAIRTTGRGDLRAPDGKRWVGLKIHVRHLALKTDLEMHIGRGGYIGLSPVENGAVNVSGLFPSLPPGGQTVPEKLIAAATHIGLKDLATRLRHAAPVDGSGAATAGLNYRRFSPPQTGLCLGDAWAAIPPLTGHGMALAMVEASIAVPCIHAWHSSTSSWESLAGEVSCRITSRVRPTLRRARFLHALVLMPAMQPFLAAAASTGVLPFKKLFHLTHLS